MVSLYRWMSSTDTISLDFSATSVAIFERTSDQTPGRYEDVVEDNLAQHGRYVPIRPLQTLSVDGLSAAKIGPRECYKQ